MNAPLSPLEAEPDRYRIEVAAPGETRYLSSSAVFSLDGKYRFVLERQWSDQEATALWVMLNPSEAGAVANDPTVGRCVSFSQALGCGRMRVLNLNALIATDPRELLKHPDPVGQGNDELLAADLYAMNERPGVVIVAWGTHARGDRVRFFLDHAYGQWCLGYNQDGSPKHPLYLAKTTALSIWPR